MKNCFLLNDILTIFALKNFGKIKVVINNIWKKKSLGNVLSYIIQNLLDLMALGSYLLTSYKEKSKPLSLMYTTFNI